MKDNKDEEKTLFQAIDAVDDKFLMETLKDMEKRKNQNHKQQLKFKQMTPMVKAATIALICFLTLGISVSVAAATSKTFRQWIQKTFMSQTIYKVTQTKDVSDHKKNQKIVLAVGINNLRMRDFAVRSFINLELFSVAEMLKNLTVFIGNCNFHNGISFTIFA